jgi:hypothetical protein
VPGNEGIGDGAGGLRRLERGLFIRTHQTAIAGDISLENCRQLALDVMRVRTSHALSLDYE